MTQVSKDVLSFTCPRCKAQPGEQCRRSGYGVRPHQARMDAWRTSLKGENSLRGLGSAIQELARVHPCYGQASLIVQNCVDHLSVLDAFNKLMLNKKDD